MLRQLERKMAADRPLSERGFVEVKMGRSKFPGKPSKIGNRKRVNLSSCALPDDNDSSKAAKNIYLGLSVFNETFGDNEMVAPGPFHGFSMIEVEEAMAEAKLQQNEAELEHKKQGININLWDNFQNELFSIISCSSYNDLNFQVNKTKLSFDGGGSSFNEDSSKNAVEMSEKEPLKAISVKNSVLRVRKNVRHGKSKHFCNTSSKIVKFHSPRLKLPKLSGSSVLTKSLQSQAAKKLLEKAKMSNTSESNKSSAAEKKFILPNYSIHSSRVIKPNKKFLEESVNKRKLLRSKAVNCASKSKKPKVMNSLDECINFSDKTQTEEVTNKSEDEDLPKKINKADSSLSESKISDNVKSSSQISNTGKVILREARLQLDKSNSSLLEGPFSSPSASSLSPNSQLKINSIQSATALKSVVCGVCGVVRFYRFVEIGKKFGIYCCDSCRKFISKIIKGYSSEKLLKLQCTKGKGLCTIVSIVKSQHLNAGTYVKNPKCEACWLKLCLKTFKMPVKLKQKLLKLLPVNMQLGINLELDSILSNDINSRFKISNNIKDFKWVTENCRNANQIKFSCNDKQSNWPITVDSVVSEISLRKRNRVGSENFSKFLNQNGKSKLDSEEKNRQSIVFKGPRVKHVCRSASVVLGQPLATFPSDTSPTKKFFNESTQDCNNCDNLVATNNELDSQGVIEKSNKEVTVADVKQEKKSNVPKQVLNSKGINVALQSAGTKSKKKNVKTENPVSMDFWECYDPDEVCETGFGLIGSESFSVRALCFLCGSSGQEKLIHCASCCEPYHEFCVNEGQLKLQDGTWKYDWVCPRCTVCFTCGRTSGQQLKCIKCDNSYHTECVDRVGGRLLYSPDRPWVCSVCLRCKSCNGVDVSVFVGNLPLCKACFILRQKGNYCPLCQRCYEDDDYDSKMMECGQCKCWVHAKCEGLSDEKYQVLSFLPESVEYVCRMCCVMPPAPWWLAVEAELKSGYLGVLKALSKNRKVCTMLKWSPRKQCTCRQVSRTLDFEDVKFVKSLSDGKIENPVTSKEENKVVGLGNFGDKEKDEKYQPAGVAERKTSIEVISHPTESLKLTLKILKTAEIDEKEKPESCNVVEDSNYVKHLHKDSTIRVKKCLSNEENSEDSLTNTFDYPEESQVLLQSLFKGNDFATSSDVPDKRLLSSPLNPPSDSGIGSTDDELKASCLTDEESCKLDDQQPNAHRIVGELKSNCDSSVSFLEEKRDCFCFLEVDSYNSRSKPFSPNLMSIKKKVTTSEYTSLHQFHQDMQAMIATTQSDELMDLYHQTIKEIFPWFDPKYSRVQSNSQKVSGTMSLESTPVKSTPTKSALLEECKVPKEGLSNKCLDYFYSDHIVEDSRICLMCKTTGDGPPGDTGRLLYCGQNEWVHCNCALWSGEVFEEIDGSLQNVHSAISRGRSIRCPECSLKGASIGCCARNCQETYHFRCARQVGCVFMDDKTVYCPAHVKESAGKLVQNEKEFEIRRPVYVELDKRKMKTVDSSQIRFAVGALQVNNLGKFVHKLSDQPEAIMPEQFECTRLFWSCYEPWRIVRYHFSVRLVDEEDNEGIDCGINFTIDHSKEPELVELKLKQLKYFQDHNTLLDVSETVVEEALREKCKFSNVKGTEDFFKGRADEVMKMTPVKRPKKDHKVVKRIFDHFDAKDDENCLSDNQNTAGLLPPDLEEAIFKDLPNDILDGISMQDIFMDIKNDSYDVNTKEGVSDDADTEDIPESISSKSRKQDYHTETTSQLEFWVDVNECRQETTEDTLSKTAKDLKKNKYESLQNQQIKKNGTLRTYQKSGSCGFSCRTETPSSKWKKNSKCHVTVNLVESPERGNMGNMLQELKFTDGLVTVSTGTIDSVKDLKVRLEDSKCSIQREEGKENKCLPWRTRLQPRLLQVDGGVDSSSSGSEAGESPQRLIDENINSKIVTLPQTSPFLDTLEYSVNSPFHSGPTSFVAKSENFPCSFSSVYPVDTRGQSSRNSLPQLDGVSDLHSDGSDVEDFFDKSRLLFKKPRKENILSSDLSVRKMNFKIIQCDGGVDSESDDSESSKPVKDNPYFSSETLQTRDEPVKCKQCHCTYRTKISYQRHLETCCSDFILSSSEGEMSEEETPKKPSINESFEAEKKPVHEKEKKIEDGFPKKNEINVSISNANQTSISNISVIEKSPEVTEKLEVKKEKVLKRTYARKKPSQNANPPLQRSTSQVQQILVQQPSAPPTLLVQDISAPNLMPTTFTDSGSTIGYVAAVDSQNPFAKPQLIATPNGIISGGFQLPSTPDTQIFNGLCINPQAVQTNIPGIIIQPPHPSGPVISSQPGPVLMSNEQVMLGPTGFFDVIQDPGTGGMYLASHSQPVFYNMETIVSNTVMQTNQFVSNVLATSFSQTSTQIFQAREMEQVVNLPSNYIVLAANPPDKILPSDALICVQTPQALIPNQTPMQIPNQPIFNASFQGPQAINTEPKIISTQLNPIRCLQPLQVKQICPSVVVNKIANANTQMLSQPVTQVFRAPDTNLGKPLATAYTKTKPMISNTTNASNPVRSVPMMRPNVSKSSPKGYEKAVVTSKPKSQVQQRSRALVDYINSFRFDISDGFSSKDTPQNQKIEHHNQLNVETKSDPMNTPDRAVLGLIKSSKSLENAADLEGSSEVFKLSYIVKSPCDVETPQIQLPGDAPPTAFTEAPTDIPAPNIIQQINPTVNSEDHSKKSDPTLLGSKKCKSEESPSLQRKSEPETLGSVKNEKNEISHPISKVLSNISNSFPFEREPNPNLSLPCLEEFSPPCEDQQKPDEITSNEAKYTSEVLPLQDSSQSLNTKMSSKSPQKISTVKNKSPSSEEKNKIKKRIVSSDQNSPDSTLLTENLNELRDEPVKKSNSNRFSFYKKCEEKGPKLIFDVISDDGFKSSSTSMVELWANICDSVQEMRAVLKIPPLPVSRKGHEILGMQNHGLQHCLEQLKGVEQCLKYKCKYFVRNVPKGEEDESQIEKVNLSGCARTEKFTNRKEYDMFAWLASKHRQLPKLTESAEETLSSIRRANSLPMAMRYRNLKETAKLYVGVYRSKIHGRGLFCLREIEAGEMVIEYAGEVIRSNLTDKREKYYTEKGIGCYMFRIDDHFVVDATMKGNAARFINHSCEPNCYSRVVDILGKKHIVIFALRRINVMEELTYDYKFPFEDEKISCHCLSKKCRKYLN